MDPADLLAADLTITPAPRPAAIADALRDRRIPGVVGASSATVAVTLDGRLVVMDADGHLAATDADPVVAALAARWGADVILDGETIFAAASGGARTDAETRSQDDAETRSQDGADRVHIVRGELPADPARRLELAAQLEASVSIVTVDGVHLVVGHSPVRDYWPPAQRPVIVLERGGEGLRLQVYSRTMLTVGGMRDRLAMRGIPDIEATWPAAVTSVLEDSGADRRDVRDVQRMLRGGRVRIGTVTGDHPDPAAALAEVGATAADLARLARHGGEELLVNAIGDVLGLPAEAADLLLRRMRVDDLPGAQHIERTGAARIVWEQVMSPPAGASLWRRWRRLAFTRPRLAATLTVIEAGLTAALIAYLLWASPAAPWNVVLWIAASVLVVDVATDVILLLAIRRRRD